MNANPILGDGFYDVKVPKNKIIKHIIDEAFVIDKLDEKLVRFFSTNISGYIEGLTGYIKLNEDDGERELLQVERLDVDVNSIGRTPKDTWIPVAYIDIGLNQLKLRTSAGHMIALIDIFQDNVDEPSDFIKTHNKYWKRIEFGVNLNSGTFGLGMMKINKEFAKRENGH